MLVVHSVPGHSELVCLMVLVNSGGAIQRMAVDALSGNVDIPVETRIIILSGSVYKKTQLSLTNRARHFVQ